MERGRGRERTHPVWAVGSHGCGEYDGAFGALLDPRLGYGCSAVVGTEDLNAFNSVKFDYVPIYFFFFPCFLLKIRKTCIELEYLMELLVVKV